MCTPYQWTKQVASHWGGTRNGTVIHWPNGFAGRGEIRNQFHHVIDLAPTVLDCAGLPEPTFVNGVQQSPYEGISMRYSFGDAGAADRRTTQYFEMFCNRGIYHHGWTAVTRHSTPWDPNAPAVAFDDDVWELYDEGDWTQSRDLAAVMPDKLAELQRMWLIEVSKYNVLPLDDRRVERFNPDFAGRPVLVSGNRQLLYGGMGRLSENSVLNVKNKSHSVTALVEVSETTSGVIMAQGGEFGGWSLYIVDGKLRYCYNTFGVEHAYVGSDEPVPAGEHQLRFEFAYDGGGLGKGGTVSLYVDGENVGEGRVENTVPMMFSTDETADVGVDNASPVAEDYPQDTRFTGKIQWVQIDLGDDNHDHLISPDELMRVAMIRQ
jgi:arylsulfatase